VTQPLGEFYIASIPAKQIVDITEFDVRRVLYEDRDIERYLGIQRPLNRARVKTIKDYVTTKDACFPTGVIVAVPLACVTLNDNESIMKLSNIPESTPEQPAVYYRNIARVLDGQHRLAGLMDYAGDDFELNVSIFVDADIADQANIFSTVNLAQTKVNASLAYDLFDLAKTRSPQGVCHKIVVTLDKEAASPFYKKIKRLGVATVGRFNETLTQATVIAGFLPYISANPMMDRDLYLRNRRPEKIPDELLPKIPFQHMFVDEKDFEIIDILWNYFSAASTCWPNAWADKARGFVLNRTIGYQALIRFLRDVYVNLDEPYGFVPPIESFLSIFRSMNIDESEFNSEKYAYGSSGASSLYHDFMTKSGIGGG
jgi:DGQHR domain-containing protein